MAEDEDPLRRKKQLLGQLSDAELAAADIVRAGQQIVESGQHIHDLAAAERRFVEGIPTDGFVASERWDAQISTWSGVNSQINAQRDALRGGTTIPFIANYTTVTTSGFVSPTIFSMQPSPTEAKSLESAFEQYSQVLHAMGWSARAETELRRFGLDAHLQGQRSPLEQIRSAEEAYLRPTGNEQNPAAVLIPMREAIETTLSELVRRRPKQEPAKSWRDKVLSLGRQAAAPGITEEHLQRFATELGALIDDLSGGKQRSFPRYQLRTLLDRGTSFLTAFLAALDHHRLPR